MVNLLFKNENEPTCPNHTYVLDNSSLIVFEHVLQLLKSNWALTLLIKKKQLNTSLN